MEKLKIATTSFIWPDSRIYNVKKLKKYVDEVELLYFESKNKDSQPSYKEIAVFKETNLVYSVHLPTDIDYKKVDCFEKLHNFISAFNEVNISYFILHLPYIREFVEKIHLLEKSYNVKILVENTQGNANIVEECINYGIDICLDIGHLLAKNSNYDIMNIIEKYKKHIKYLHIHGVKKENSAETARDHSSLKYIDRYLLNYIKDFAKKYGIVFCIEVFNKDDLFESLEIIK
jgi:hypothetical protein